MICQIISAYFQDDCADALTNDPVLKAIPEKDALASQLTLSRFWNRMDEDILSQLEIITAKMRDVVYTIKHPVRILFDLDSTLLNTYGTQEGEGFNSTGILCFFADNYPVIVNEMPIFKIPEVKINLISLP